MDFTEFFSGRDGGLACIAVRPRVASRATTTPFQVAGSSRSHPSITATTASFFYIVAGWRPRTASAQTHGSTRLPATIRSRSLAPSSAEWWTTTARAERAPGRSIEVVALWERRSRHAAGELRAAGGRGGPAMGARDEPVADDGRGVVDEGAGDRAAAGGDAGDAARPPRVRVRALAHRPRREGRRRGRRRRRRSRRCCCCARARGEDRGEGHGGAVGVWRAAAGAAGSGEARAEGVGAAAGQRERRRGQLPQQQRRRPAQLLHAAVAHPELHRAAPHPDVVRLRLPEPQRRIRLQQQGEGEGPGRRDRQVLVVAVGSAVAQVQPAGPGRAAQRERFRHAHRVGRHPQSGQALRSAVQNLSRFFSSAAGCVAGFQLQLCAVRLSVHICSACDVIY